MTSSSSCGYCCSSLLRTVASMCLASSYAEITTVTRGVMACDCTGRGRSTLSKATHSG